MPIRIRANPGRYAEACLSPATHSGRSNRRDVLRRCRPADSERGMLGYSGTFNGKPVSVQSSGMGCPSAAIAIEELVQLGVKKIMRGGACGGLPARHDDGRPRRRDGRHGRRLDRVALRARCGPLAHRRLPRSSTRRCTLPSTSASRWGEPSHERATSSTSGSQTSRAARPIVGSSRSRWGCRAVHARSAAEVPGGLHADRQRRDRRGRSCPPSATTRTCGRAIRAGWRKVRAAARDRVGNGGCRGHKNVFLVRPGCGERVHRTDAGPRWRARPRAPGSRVARLRQASDAGGHLGELAREAGARRLTPARRGGRRQLSSRRGGQRPRRIANPPAIRPSSPAARVRGFVRTFRHSRRHRGSLTVALAGESQSIKVGVGWSYGRPGLKPTRARRSFRSCKRRHERRDRAAGQRHVRRRSARKHPASWPRFTTSSAGVVCRGDPPDSKRRDPQRTDARRRRGPSSAAGMRSTGARSPATACCNIHHDRRRHQAGSRADDGEDLSRHAPAAPEGRGTSASRSSPSRVSRCQLDGEQPGTTPARFEVLPQPLQLRVPAA